jgi:hypothetical protein
VGNRSRPEPTSEFDVDLIDAAAAMAGARSTAGRSRLRALWQITSGGTEAKTTRAGASHQSADTPAIIPGTGSAHLPTTQPTRKRKVLPLRAVRATIRGKWLGFSGLVF